MSKRKSKTIGYIICPFCLSEAEVCQTEGKDYKFIACPVDGTINALKFSNAQGYQDFIEDKMNNIIEGEYQNITPEEKTPECEPATVECDDNFWPEGFA